MARRKEKPMSYYVGRAGSWSKRQLNTLEVAIDKIENSNFLVRYFNRESLDLLKKQKQYVKVMLQKERAFVEYKKLQGTPNQVEIVKANKALEKQLTAWEDIKYVSKREENQIANKPRKRKVRADKWKTHNYKRRNTLLKAEEVINVKPRRLFYD